MYKADICNSFQVIAWTDTFTPLPNDSWAPRSTQPEYALGEQAAMSTQQKLGK